MTEDILGHLTVDFPFAWEWDWFRRGGGNFQYFLNHSTPHEKQEGLGHFLFLCPLFREEPYTPARSRGRFIQTHVNLLADQADGG